MLRGNLLKSCHVDYRRDMNNPFTCWLNNYRTVVEADAEARLAGSAVLSETKLRCVIVVLTYEVRSVEQYARSKSLLISITVPCLIHFICCGVHATASFFGCRD
ncbi:hypothetical protein Droror1_Dr00006829 [Drosera rotundifolia]